MSIQETEAYAAKGATAPRVRLSDIEEYINARYDLTAFDAVGPEAPRHEALRLLSICILVMRNGFVVIGKSAPAAPENFSREKGRTFAYEDCIRQLWPLMGFALRDRLYADEVTERLIEANEEDIGATS